MKTPLYCYWKCGEPGWRLTNRLFLKSHEGARKRVVGFIYSLYLMMDLEIKFISFLVFSVYFGRFLWRILWDQKVGRGSWHRSNVLVLLAKHRPMIFSHMVHNFPFVFDREDHWKEWKTAMKFVHKKIKQEIILLVEDSVFRYWIKVPLWNHFISFLSNTSSLCVIEVGLRRESLLDIMLKWGDIMNWTRIF